MNEARERPAAAGGLAWRLFADLRWLLRVYRALLLAEVQNAAQYRVQMFLWLLFAMIRPVIFLAAWAAVATAQGGSVGGYSVPDFAAYYMGLSLVIQLNMAWHAWDFELYVRQGRLSSRLLRPLHPIHYAVVENLTWKGFTLLGLLPALALIGVSSGARVSDGWQWWHAALFVPSVLLGATLTFLLNWVVACVGFWTTRVQSLTVVVDRVAFIFAGQIAPVALLPGWLATVAYGLPFAYSYGVPAEILRGAPTLERALVLLAGQVAWVAAAYALLQLAWRQGVKQYSAVGA